MKYTNYVLLQNRSEIEYRIIECTACNQRHRLILETNYEWVLYDVSPLSEEERRKLLSSNEVSYTLVYKCPIKSARMGVTLKFPSVHGKRFMNSGVKEVELNW
ncbi:MAG: hypothetical protein WA667_08070 [Candidatus Nitrosopolaris sp.]